MKIVIETRVQLVLAITYKINRRSYNVIVDIFYHTVNVRVKKLKIKLQNFILLLSKLDLCIFLSIKHSLHFDGQICHQYYRRLVSLLSYMPSVLYIYNVIVQYKFI